MQETNSLQSTDAPNTVDNPTPKTVGDSITVAEMLAAAAAAATATLNDLNLYHCQNPMACVFVNNTQDTWTQVDGYGQPVHGSLAQAPAASVPNIFDYTIGPDSSVEENNNTGWAMESDQEGSELLLIFTNDQQEQSLYLSLYVKNPYSGAPEVGVSISDSQWFLANQKAGDPHGKWMIDHIHKVTSDFCKLAKNGDTLSVDMNSFTVTFQATQGRGQFDMFSASIQSV